MIIDTIENLSKYVALNPLFADVVEFLKNNDLQTMEPGKYPIKDKNLFLNLLREFLLTHRLRIFCQDFLVHLCRICPPESPV